MRPDYWLFRSRDEFYTKSSESRSEEEGAEAKQSCVQRGGIRFDI